MLRTSIILFLSLFRVAHPQSPSPHQTGRIDFNHQSLFLSGGNIAWVDFAHDIGPGFTDFDAFAQIFEDVHRNGGNSLRFWLHTNGASSPAFDAAGKVTGPGEGTISDLQTTLDLAWEHRVGLILCLWSFDMLRMQYGDPINKRARLMLTDTTFTNAYIRNALLPMVTSVAQHPAIIAWEIFNEPEGMSAELGWDFTHHVSMLDIQRFINLAAGEIHRAAPGALVTNGAWSFISQTDVVTLAARNEEKSLNAGRKKQIEKQFRQRYGVERDAESILSHFRSRANFNYYTDARLLTAGGDSLGYLDFYTVHYYDWAGTSLSPFHQTFSAWNLGKPLAVTEFFMQETFGIAQQGLYETLYENGYAGAQGWQFFDGEPHRSRMLTAMQAMFDAHPEEVGIIVDSTVTDISFDRGQQPPDHFLLAQNHPNPFNPVTTISFYLASDAEVDLQIFDLRGRLVAKPLDRNFKSPGRHQVKFNAGNLPSGVYFYRLRTHVFSDVKRMLVLR